MDSSKLMSLFTWDFEDVKFCVNTGQNKLPAIKTPFNL